MVYNAEIVVETTTTTQQINNELFENAQESNKVETASDLPTVQGTEAKHVEEAAETIQETSNLIYNFDFINLI